MRLTSRRRAVVRSAQLPRLGHILWMAAFTAARECPISRAYYEKKHAEGKNRRQAILALARRRVDVLWALIRDRKPSAGRQ